MLNNHAAYKYLIPYDVPFVITKCWTNGMFTLQCVPKKSKNDIGRINPYISDTNVEDINIEKYIERYSTHDHQLYTYVFY